MTDTGRFTVNALLRVLEKEIKKPISKRIKATLRLAYDGHKGQFRNSRTQRQGPPFIVHPVGTACIAAKLYPMGKGLADIETIICTALAHDILEDTRLDSKTLESVIGAQATAYVEALTKPLVDAGEKTTEERNKLLLNRIIHAGPTAVFIKICDSMHNLSRPESAPQTLLKKLIDKAHKQYLPLLDTCPIGDGIAQAYKDAIQKGEEMLQRQSEWPDILPTADSVESAISVCIAATTGKILELHDIEDIVTRVCGAKSTCIWRLLPDKTAAIQVGGPPVEFNVNEIGFEDIESAPHLVEGQKTSKLIRNLCGQRYESMFTVPIQIDSYNRLVVGICFGSEGYPKWFSLDTATILVQFLSHRLVLSRSDACVRLAAIAAQLGIQMDVDLAIGLNIQPAELEDLQNWRLRCEQAVIHMRHLIDDYIMAEVSTTRELMRLETRVKSVDSILRKCCVSNRYTWPNYKGIEDIAGVRIVCPLITDIEKIERFLMSSAAREAGVTFNPNTRDARRDYVANPTPGGYKAIHLILEVKTYQAKEGIIAVPCEIQLRSIFQDAWAHISHATLYQATRKVRRKFSEIVKKIGLSVDACDRAIAELMEENHSVSSESEFKQE